MVISKMKIIKKRTTSIQMKKELIRLFSSIHQYFLPFLKNTVVLTPLILVVTGGWCAQRKTR